MGEKWVEVTWETSGFAFGLTMRHNAGVGITDARMQFVRS